MAQETTTAASVEVPAHGGLAGLFPTNAKGISNEMMLLTWLAFLITVILLHRLAWKPILRALDKRERDIRASLDDAARAHQQAENSAGESRRIVAEAADRARAMTEETRMATERSAARIEKEAQDKSRHLLENANLEIAAAQRRAIEDLRREAAALAIQLSERMLAEQLTPEQRRAYEQRMAGKLPS
jgi:F-type H+-transporting ATPase subunit b